MAMSFFNFDLKRCTACIVAACTLICTTACGSEKTESDNKTGQHDIEDQENSVQKAPPNEDPSETIRTPVIEDANQSGNMAFRPADSYQVDWSGDDGACLSVASVLNEKFSWPSVDLDYAETQLRSSLGTRRNVDWLGVSGEAESVILDYFNDGVDRYIERRRGMLSGNRIVSLWIKDNEEDYAHLNFGHAGANTVDLIGVDDLHTKLTYSLADIINIEEQYFTLVAPLKDYDTHATVFVITWSPKDSTLEARRPQDYYPHVLCVMTPVTRE